MENLFKFLEGFYFLKIAIYNKGNKPRKTSQELAEDLEPNKENGRRVDQEELYV